MSNLVQLTGPLLERGLIPDPLIRIGMRSLLRRKIIDESQGLEQSQERLMAFVEKLRAAPIAEETRAANEQHYEVPTEFFQQVLGKHMKYSSGYWRPGVTELDQSDEDMLALTVERARLSDGQAILELGCGWGSLSLFMASRFPRSRITGVSNSRTQKQYIDGECARRGIRNLEIITADMNVFTTDQRFDRVVSVEMFEHMRNYQALLKKVAGFLNPQGQMFVHIFTHKDFGYFYEAQDESDWIGKYFFTGGVMPSDHLLLYFPEDFVIERHWRVSGTHYQKTSEAWLRRMDAHREAIMPILERAYGPTQKKKWWNYWRIFFMACAELWGYQKGTEWIVSHYLFRKR